VLDIVVADKYSSYRLSFWIVKLDGILDAFWSLFDLRLPTTNDTHK